MSTTIDRKVVEMRFDNSRFERNTKESIGTLEKLKNALNFDGAAKGLDSLNAASKNVSFDKMASSIESLEKRFSAFGIIGMRVLQNMTDSAMAFAKRGISVIEDSIISGGKRRAMNIENAHFQLQALLKDEEKVQAVMDNAMQSVDGTAYAYDEAAKAAAMFAATGLQAGDEMLQALRGIVGVSAMTNSEFESIANIFTTVAGQGRVMADQLNQLATRGLNGAATIADFFNRVNMGTAEASDEVKKAVAEISEGFYTTEGDIREFVSDGQISFKIFSEAMTEAFAESAERANETFTGSLSNIKSALARIGAGFFSPLVEQNSEVVKLFNNLRVKINEFKRWLVFDEQRKNVHALSKQFTDSVLGMAKSANEFLESWDPREAIWTVLNLVRSVQDVFRGLLSVLKPIGSAFLDVFKIDSTAIYEASERLKYFTNHLKLSDENAKLVHDAFQGLFSGLKIGIKIFTAGLEILSPFGDVLKFVAKGFLTAAAAMGEMIFGLDKTAFSTENVSSVVVVAKEYVQKFCDAFIGGLGETWELLKKVYEVIKPVLTVVKDLALGLAGLTFQGLSSLDFSFLKDIPAKLNEEFPKFIQSVSDAFHNFKLPQVDFTGFTSKIKKFIGEFKKSLSLKDVTVEYDDITNSTRSMVDRLKDTYTSSGDIFKGIKEKISTAVNGLKPYLKQVVDWLIGFVKQITPGNLIGGIATISFASLVDPIKEFLKSGSKIKKSVSETLNGLKDTLLGYQDKVKPTKIKEVAVAVGILAASLVALSLVPADKMNKALIGLAAALSELVIAVAVLNRIDAPKSSNMTKLASSFIAISIAIEVLASAVKKLGKMEYQDMIQGLGGAVILIESLVIAASQLKGVDSHINKAAKALVSIASAVTILTIPVKILGGMDFESLVTGIGGLIVILTALTVAVKTLDDVSGANLLGVGAGILIMANAALVMSGVVAIFGVMPLSMIGQGLLGMAAALAEFVIAANLMKSTLPGAAAMLVMATSLAAFVPALLLLGAVPFNIIKQGILAIAAVFATLGISALALSSLIPSILALSAALVLISSSLVIAGAGLALLSAGIAAFVAVVVPGAAAILTAFGVLGSGIGVLLVSLGVTLVGGIGLIGKLLIKSILELAPGIVEALTVLAETAVKVLIGILPKVLLSILEILITYAGPFVDKLVELVVGTLNSLANALRDNADAIFDAVLNILEAILELVITALQKIVELIPFFGDMISDSLEGTKEIFRDAMGVDAGEEIGSNFIKGAVDGVKNKEPEAVSAMDALGIKSTGALSDALKDSESIGETSILNFLNGESSKSGDVSSMGSTLGGLNLEGLMSNSGDFLTGGETDANNFLKGFGSKSSLFEDVGEEGADSIFSGLSYNEDLFKELGLDETDDYLSAFEDAEDDAKRAGQDVSDSAMEGISKNSDNFDDVGKQNVEAYVNPFNKGKKDARLAAGDIATEQTKELGSYKADFKKEGKSNFSAYGDGVSSTKADIKKKTGDVVSAGLDAINSPDNQSKAKRATSEVGMAGLSALEGLKTEYVTAGEQAGEGLALGIQNKSSLVTSAAKNLAQGALEAIRGKKGLDEHSPSRATELYGEQASQGLAQGIDNTVSLPMRSGEKAGEKTAKSVGKGVKKGTASTKKAVKTFAETVKEAIEGQMDIFSEFNKTTEMSAEKLLENMKSQISGMKEWASEIKELAQRGISKGLLKELSEMGPKSYQYTHALVTMTDKELQEYSKSWAAAQKIPDQVTKIVSESMNVAGKTAAKGFTSGLSSVSTGMETVSKEVEQRMKRIAETIKRETSEMKKKVEENVKSQMNLFEKYETSTEKTFDTLMENLKSNVSAMKNWANNIQQLARRGISEGLLKELSEMGPKSAAEVQALVNATDAQLKEYSEKWEYWTTKGPAKVAKIVANSSAELKMAAQGLSQPVVESANVIEQAFAKVKKQTKELKSTMKETLSSQIDMFNKFDDTVSTTIDDMIDVLNSNIKAVSNWSKNMQTLIKRGLNPDAFQVFVDKGTSSYAEVQALVDASQEKFEEWNSKWEKLEEAPGKAAKKVSKTFQDFQEVIELGMGAPIEKTTEKVVSRFKIVRQEAKALRDTVVETVKSQINIFEELSTETDLTGEKIIANMKSWYTSIAEANENFAKLATRGVSTALIEAWASMGTDGFKYAKAALEWSPEQIAEANSMYTDYGTKLGESFGDSIYSSYKEAGYKTVQGYQSGVDAGKEELKKSAAEIQNILSPAEIFAQKMETAMPLINKKAEELKAQVSDIVSSQMNLFEEFSKSTELSATQILENMKSQVLGVTEWSTNMVELGKRGVAQGLLDQLAQLGPSGSQYVGAFITMTKEQINEANAWYEMSLKMPESVGDAISKSFQTTAEQAVEGYRQAIDTTAGTKEMEELANNSLKAIKKTLAIASPSKEMYKIGQYADQGIKNGISDGTPSVVTTAKNMAAKVLTAVKTDLRQELFTAIGRGIPNGIKAGIEAGLQSAVNTAKQLASEVKSQINTIITKATFATYGQRIPMGLEQGIKNTQASLLNRCVTVCSEIKSKFESNLTAAKYQYFGENIINGIINGVAMKQSALIMACVNTAIAAYNATKAALAIKSPSRLFKELGYYSVVGFARGFSDYSNIAEDAAEETGLDAYGSMSKVIHDLPNKLDGALDMNPVIRPTLDLSAVTEGAKELNALFSQQQAEIAMAKFKISEETTGVAGDGAPSYNFVQNNYSPKALSRYDIYRNTQNQIAQIKQITRK